MTSITQPLLQGQQSYGSVNQHLTGSPFGRLPQDVVLHIVGPHIGNPAIASISKAFNKKSKALSQITVETLKTNRAIQTLCPQEDSLKGIYTKLSKALKILPGGKKQLKEINQQYGNALSVSVEKFEKLAEAAKEGILKIRPHIASLPARRPILDNKIVTFICLLILTALFATTLLFPLNPIACVIAIVSLMSLVTVIVNGLINIHYRYSSHGRIEKLFANNLAALQTDLRR